MTKICHIISAFDRYDTRIFWKQCRSLAQAGHDVYLLVNDDKKAEVIDGVKIIVSNFKAKNRLQRILLSNKRNIKKALEVNADIYQIHDPEMIPLGLKLKRSDKIVIFDSHEDFPMQILEKEYIPFFLRRILSTFSKYYYSRNLKKFNSIITVTPHIVDSLKRYSKEVHLITNYPIIENNYIEFSEDNYLKRSNTMCYAGTVYTNSLQENLLNAIRYINNLKYIIVGSIAEDYFKQLSNLAAWGNVNFVNRVPKDQLLKIYQSVTIGIVLFDYSPNVGYKIGTLGNNKIFEYMHSGLPIICTDFVLWRQIIDKYHCGICVNPHNLDEIEKAVKYLIDNKSEAYQMGQNGRRAVLEEFNWGTQEKKYLEVVNSLIK